MSQQFDFCILGAGLAGLSIADSLAEHDFSTAVIDREDIAAGASGTPGGLVNPATGRRAKKVWKAEQCYTTTLQCLQKVQETTEDHFFAKNGVLRPALMEKMARKMRNEYEQTSWPKDWCQWKSEGQIKEMHPGITCVNGGLWLPVGLTVDVGQYLHAYAAYLEQEAGTTFFLNQDPIERYDDGYWRIKLEKTMIRAKHIVFATGRATATSYHWDWLPFNLIKGQVAEFKTANNALGFDHSISSLGYMARLGYDGTFIQGSTYEHDYTHLDPDDQGEEYLRKRLRRTLPRLEKDVTTVNQWAGVRTSTPDYMPILGQHPTDKNLHLFSGLGSKGLLHSKFLADHYVDHLVNGSELYPEIDIRRYCLTNT
ncbi:NAD(P)/FAD-dependent oxidoreductase [Fodinibius halophilus]|uniref:FAD-binding oxidoreductase n=1 Tax=Fodinibius halophilus TaxID=1736908 RepID=A0A6M1T472_9BACT|nr:FAD-binding oxidoreductase [Fodinibius halophilus]NGP88889.1 FAD-binding oxidoreductase [Fodinibius halophilus]